MLIIAAEQTSIDRPPGCRRNELEDRAGGLYAVTRLVGIPNITPTWKRLVAWMEGSPYEHGRHQWLEKHISTVEAPEDELTIDLYLPIED